MDTANPIMINEDLAYDILLKLIKASEPAFQHIAVKGRGGLSIAQKLGYDLDIPSIYFIDQVDSKPNTLFVDDIECTSTTLLDLELECKVAVLCQRTSSKKLAEFVGKTIEGNKYVVFSWEAQDGRF